MNELIRTNLKKRKNGKKGFTLVEVIVVLVILAILAAILIPAMTGWMKKAEDKSAIIEARTVKIAIQTIVADYYKDVSVVVPVTAGTGTNEKVKSYTIADTVNNEILALAEVSTSSKARLDNATLDLNKAVNGFVYTTKDGKYTVTYANENFNVVEK